MRTRRKEISQVRAGDTGECRFLFTYKMKSVCACVSFLFFTVYSASLLEGTAQVVRLRVWTLFLGGCNSNGWREKGSGEKGRGKGEAFHEKLMWLCACKCMDCSLSKCFVIERVEANALKEHSKRAEWSWGKMHWSFELSLNLIMYFSSAWRAHRLYLWTAAVVK